MAQSLSLMYIHIIFHIKNDYRTIRTEEAEPLYQYIGGLLKNKHCQLIKIGGMPDHIHILCVLSKNISLADLVRDLKRSSALWLKKQDIWYDKFTWQGGYGAFSTGVSSYQKTVRYIENQREHHRRRSFREEYLLLLKNSGIEFNESYLWED